MSYSCRGWLRQSLSNPAGGTTWHTNQQSNLSQFITASEDLCKKKYLFMINTYKFNVNFKYIFRCVCVSSFYKQILRVSLPTNVSNDLGKPCRCCVSIKFPICDFLHAYTSCNTTRVFLLYLSLSLFTLTRPNPTRFTLWRHPETLRSWSSGLPGSWGDQTTGRLQVRLLVFLSMLNQMSLKHPRTLFLCL